MNMHERIMAGKLFTDMCEGLPEERDEAKKRMIAFNLTTPDTLEERLCIQKEMLHESSGEAWIEPPFYFCYGRHIILGEGSVVVKDIPANVVAVGNPYRVLREIGGKDMEYYYRDRKIDPEDLKEEAELRKG